MSFLKNVFQQRCCTYVNFEDVKYAIKNPDKFILLNTLPTEKQKCLIYTTLHASDEERVMNEMIHSIRVPDKKIVIYGENHCDETIDSKLNSLINFGLNEVFVYKGGMFEWVLLQDIYGKDDFPTTETELDILKFKNGRYFR